MAQHLADMEGKYEIVAKIKEGGMGAIYKVRHRLLDEVRVIKALRPQHEDDEELRARFAREARSAIRLRHPNVVQIFDFSSDEMGAGLIVMEHIAGVDLEQLIRRRRLPSLGLALEVARQSLRALGYLHEHGFVHRDVSPDNLMLTRDVDGRPLVKLIDLGIAKRLDAEQQLTVSGSFLGKFRYASPEHFGARGEHGLDRRSDLYSFGLVLYELLTGHYPLTAQSTSQLIGAHLFHAPRPFDETDPAARVPEPVRAMVLRALDKDADARPADAAEWIAEIEALQRAMASDGDREKLVAGLGEETAALAASTPEGDGTGPFTPSPEGATQRQLNEQFHLERTPSPSAIHTSPRPESSVGAAADAAALDALVEGARALGRIGHVRQARRQLETVLALDPDHQGARHLVAELGAGPAAQGADGPPPPPSPAPTSSRAAGPSSSRPSEAEREARTERTVRKMLAAAEEKLQAAEYEDALDLLHRARDMAPRSGTVVEQLARGVARLDARLQERERLRAIEQIELHVLAALRRGKLGRARRDVARARDAYGDDEVFHTLDRILDGAATDRAQTLCKEAAAARAEGRWDDAEEKLEAAEALVAEIDESRVTVRKQLEDLRAARRRAERTKVSSGGLLAAVAEIERLRMEEGREAARDALDEAIFHFGEAPILEEVRAALDGEAHEPAP